MPRKHLILSALLLSTLLASLSLLHAESPPTTQPSSLSTRSSVTLAPVFERRLLEKLTLASVMDPAPKDNQLVFPDISTALHLNKSAYASNEPVTAYAVIKLTNDKEGRSIPVAFSIGDTGEKVTTPAEPAANNNPNRARANFNNFSALRTYIPAAGYWVTSGDLRNLTTTGKLPPGNYIARFWAEGQRAETSFTVTSAKLPEPAPTTQSSTQPSTQPTTQTASTQPSPKDPKNASKSREAVILQLSGGWAERKDTVWPLTNVYPALRPADDFVTGLNLGLGTGPSARYYMQLNDIPTNSDEGLAVSLELEKSKEGVPECIKVTLSSVDPKKPVRIPAYPVIYLLLENLDAPSNKPVFPNRNWLQSGGDHTLTKPVTIEIRFQPQWTLQMPFKGNAQITAIVAGTPVPIAKVQPGEGENYNQAGYTPTARAVWKGIVKSTPLDMRIDTIKNPKPAVINRRGAVQILPVPAEEIEVAPPATD